jgi:hypothetical protein
MSRHKTFVDMTSYLIINHFQQPDEIKSQPKTPSYFLNIYLVCYLVYHRNITFDEILYIFVYLVKILLNMAAFVNAGTNGMRLNLDV